MCILSYSDSRRIKTFELQLLSQKASTPAPSAVARRGHRIRPYLSISLVILVLSTGTVQASPGKTDPVGAAPESFRTLTHISLRAARWYINDELTNRGTSAEGLLMNVRMVNAVFEDRHKPDLDPAAITGRFL